MNSNFLALLLNFWRKRKSSTIVAIFLSLIILNTWISNRLNPVVPENDLNTFEIVIVNSYMMNPHIQGKNQEGQIINLMFPRPFNLTGKGSYYQGISPDIQKSLVGCNAKIQVSEIRFSMLAKYRVWSLECGSIKLSYAESKQRFLKELETLHGLLIWAYLGFILTFGIAFYTEGKKK
jgi:hypothetical protein